MSDTTPTPHLELYVRSMLPDGAHERQEAVITQLETLDENDHIDGFNVIVWGKQIAPQSAAARTEEGKYILNRVAEFKQWALTNNVSLESFYQDTTVDSEAAASAYDAMALPVMGLAEYDGNELAHVAPCTKDDVVHTIMDRLERLKAGQPPALDTEHSGVSVV
ncbi:hypothetical protein Harman_24420 [Haloarcula mannanilytica]|uniref:Uncharacterized protein n=1 Tax=Haloarcula mannanilytica TaxID=2509225 RepID=A0A4C2ELG5_9EURY|nr:HTH domain-containing protein [Haloarcula mannanilytica]GCF14507.1 hypothetical protein Harman_24420 [Haloarcula mannanilytica]